MKIIKNCTSLLCTSILIGALMWAGSMTVVVVYILIKVIGAQ